MNKKLHKKSDDITDAMKQSEKLSYNFLTDKENDIIIKETNIDYDGLINLDKKDFSLSAKADFKEKENDENIAFYCKSCKKITDILDINEEKKNKIHLLCEICNKSEIIIGTTRGINEHFHLT